jgi:hypothetical protein
MPLPMMGDAAYDQYLIGLVDQLWDYRARAFGADESLFDSPRRRPDRAPVFRPEAGDRNVLVPPGSDPATALRVRRAIPPGERHRYFASMRSSQAVAQSVFANLQASGELGALAGWTDDDGLPVFPDGTVGEMRLEHTIGHLREPRPTQVDVWFDGSTRVAVECKLTEAEVGSCSRPRLPPDDPGQCDGTYRRQRDRAAKCTLTEIGVAYWDFISRLLTWPADRDLSPCPLHHTYQLVRNLLAACVTTGGAVDPDHGLAVLLYDDRNPANHPDGAVGSAWAQVNESLRSPGGLRRCSWQHLLGHLRRQGAAAWLLPALEGKYGLTAGAR